MSTRGERVRAIRRGRRGVEDESLHRDGGSRGRTWGGQLLLGGDREAAIRRRQQGEDVGGAAAAGG